MNSQYILDTLKIVFRKKKITYKQTANYLQLSEAGVKKMFASGDISLNRLLKICEMIEVSLADLIEASENRPVKKLKINRLQTNFFSKNPDYFFFFLQLANAQANVGDVIKRNNLTEKSAWKYLKKLDDLKFIRLQSHNRVEHIYSLPLSVDTKGGFFNNLRSQMAIRFIQSIRDNKGDCGNLSIALFNLSIDNIEKMKKDIQEILASYQRQSEIDKSILAKEELNEFSFLTAHSLGSFIPLVPNI